MQEDVGRGSFKGEGREFDTGDEGGTTLLDLLQHREKMVRIYFFGMYFFDIYFFVLCKDAPINTYVSKICLLPLHSTMSYIVQFILICSLNILHCSVLQFLLYILAAIVPKLPKKKEAKSRPKRKNWL